MKSTTTPVLTVKQAVAQGVNVLLPNILDYFPSAVNRYNNLHGVEDGMRIAISTLSYEIAGKEDISATQAEDIIRYTLAELGVAV